MGDATRGLVRYECDTQWGLGVMAESPSGDWVRYEDAERIAAERDVARVAAESLERLLERERADHSRPMSDATVERIRPSCGEEGGSCHAMMHSMCRRMNSMERDAARIQRARARNLVRYIRERIWSPPRTVVRRGIHAVAKWESQRHAIADRIAAKYLKEGT